MEYGRLEKPESAAATRSLTVDDYNYNNRAPNRFKLNFILFLATTLLVASAVSAALVFFSRNRVDDSGAGAGGRVHAHRPSQAISRACGRTRYQSLCFNSLLNFPGGAAASDKDLVHISVNVTLQKFGQALYSVSEISNLNMDPHVRSAYEDCLELLDDSVSLLARSLSSVGGGGGGGSPQDVLTWLSASLTNQDTCTEGFDQVNGYVKNQLSNRLKDLSELVSNCLAIYAAAAGDKDFAGVPIQNRRRRLLSSDGKGKAEQNFNRHQFPTWLNRRERMLLDAPVSAIKADVIVSKDGNGTVKTIAEAIKKAPQYSSRRFIIYVKAGKYEESILKVGRKKTNVMFIGDGKGKTVITGGKSIQDNITTFRTATFAATGAGFIARDMTFENYAGPGRHQAVALRVGADHAVIYRCNVIGYQDTLYAHSQRQFYRECDIYGTVDFMFGNAAAVFQNCTIHARKPMPYQKNTITAQNRKDPNQNTGMSIHACRIVAESDLQITKSAYPTFLGRPWKLFSRVVYMQSYIGDHVHPRGWLEWNATFALDSLYYGEYMNYGPGGAIGQRVKWPGYRVITSPEEAGKFTVAQFIYGSSWLPSTGVAFLAGLST
ncbi:probable pectinesterase/pectinesterase inhibitor 34 [Andrographis paniculata]|uniref:probable pectinesterase/pectinesterase inhibitor 34 n=1 Tax=Andrographis paniculata TaxID=175694 RepID=UPI0021E8931A|nr:probable pectinesterase/pectinesterase inhibitor 34 [Andrographis paniculata]